jgi:hypothetical protein
MSSNWFSMGSGAAASPEVAPGQPRPRPNAELRIDREAYPGWSTGAERVPRVGDEIRCSAGAGEIVSVLGKTSNGSRLLEIRLDEPGAAPFYAAASNVLISPNPPRPKPVIPEPAPKSEDEDEDSEEWIG